MDLPGIMANLELQDCSVPKIDGTAATRTLRKRSPTFFPQSSTPIKRRCSLRPQKKIQNPDTENLETYYRNDKFKTPPLQSLETIYEEPVVKKSGAVLLVGPNKHRRIIFNGKATKEKLKKRKAKVKKSIGVKNTGSIKKGKRLTMDAFLLRLHSMMSTNIPSGSDDPLTSLISSTCKITTTS